MSLALLDFQVYMHVWQMLGVHDVRGVPCAIHGLIANLFFTATHPTPADRCWHADAAQRPTFAQVG